MAVSPLLPDSSGPLERTISSVNMERLGPIAAKTAILSTLWDAWTCPASELPLLAWALSVDYFDPRWPVSRQRKVVAEAPTYHRRKTTVAGVRMALDYRDVELTDYLLPRHGIYCDTMVDPAEQSRWLDGLPEIRVYDPAPAGLDGAPPVYVGVDLYCDDDARLARKATLAKAGSETPLTIAPRGDQERIVMPFADVDVNFCGDPSSRMVAPVEIRETVLAVRPVRSGDDDFARPVAATGDLGTFVTARRRVIPGGFPPFSAVGDAGLIYAAPVTISRGYIAMKLSPEAGRQTAHKALNVTGVSRVTPPPYTAHWTVHIGRAVPYNPWPEGRLADPSARPRVADVEDAVLSAKALRDSNYLSLKSTRRLTFADLRSAKSGMRFGDRKRILSYV